MSNNILSIHIRASGKIIDELVTEFDSEQIKYNRGPICLSSGTKEWVDIITQLGTASIGAIATIIITKIKQNKRAVITTGTGEEKQIIDAASADDAIKILRELERIKKVKDITIE
ncbi:hypothetical protein ABN072_01755 [Providencia rettgeri]|uniref:hypothetical protein n=1 Tax=Providencia rettgeri TaxID=587 RepID=UPI0032DBD6B0